PFVEYISELLEGQPEPIRTFLTQASIIDRLNGPLCDAMMGRKDSQSLLAQIERTKLFLSDVEEQPGWYRFYPLIGEAVRYAAHTRMSPGGLHRAYRRASAWFSQHGPLPDAIETAFAGHAWAPGAALIERMIEGSNVFDPDQPHRLRRWLE